MPDPSYAADTYPLRRWLPSATDSWAILAGIMLTTGLPPFPGTGWLALPALAILFGTLNTAPHPARTAWLFGLAHQTSLLYWLFLLVPAASIPTRWLVPAQAVAAILYVSMFYLVWGWAFRLVRQWLGRAAALALAPVLWTGMEAWRAAGELGFPWCLSGAAWIKTVLLPWAATSGEIGLSAATALSAAALVAVCGLVGRQPADQAAERRWRWALLGSALLLWIGLGMGAGWRAAAAPGAIASERQVPVRVAAVQANVALSDKWQRAKIDSTRIPYTRLTAAAAQAGAEFVVWAETAVPAYLMYDPALRGWVSELVIANEVYLYTGFPDASLDPSGQRLKYNSSGLFAPDGLRSETYHKHHLLPIGERMPFSQHLPFLAGIDVGQAEWVPGDRPGPLGVPSAAGAFHFAGLICFESIFSDLARRAVRQGTQILVNITNDGWFGRTAGPRQHAALARLRAAECGVPLVRCANNGISFICDDKGGILAEAGLGLRTIVIADVIPGRGGTLFVMAGAWPLVGYLGLWTLLALILTRQRSKT